MLYLVAHYMDPQDLNILSQLADNLLNTGNSAEALKCTETVLKEVGNLRDHIVNLLMISL